LSTKNIVLYDGFIGDDQIGLGGTLISIVLEDGAVIEDIIGWSYDHILEQVAYLSDGITVEIVGHEGQFISRMLRNMRAGMRVPTFPTVAETDIDDMLTNIREEPT
jgi:hypothetical protein